jgi:MFS family permease
VPETHHPLYTRTFWLACAVHFTGCMSFGMFLLLPLFIQHVGGDEVTIGLVLGVGIALSVAARPAVGHLLDRIGRRRVLLWGAGLNALSFPPFLLVDASGAGLFALAAFHLVVGGALFAAYFTYVADIVPVPRRVEGIAIFGVAGMSANGLAPILGELVITASGFKAFFGSAIAFGVASLLLSLRVPSTTGGPHLAEPARLGDVVPLARHPSLRTVMLATIILGIAINAAYLFIAPYTRALAIARTGPFFAAYSATSIVIRLFGRRTLDVLGPHGIAGPGFVAFAAGLAGLAILPYAAGAAATLVLVVCGIGCGAGHGALFPVLNALAVSRAPAGKQGAVVGLHTAAIDFGAVAGLPLCGALAEWAGYPAMYATVGLASIAGLVIMARDPMR